MQPTLTDGRAAGEVEHEDAAPPHPALSEAARALLASIGGDAAAWWAMPLDAQRAKAVALLVAAGLSEADATARAAGYPDAEIIERLAVDLAARRGPVMSARTRANLGHLARGATLTTMARVASASAKKPSDGAAKIAFGLLALKILLG
jgi:hypothetical protein